MMGPYDLFVSPQGNDQWSGRWPEPKADGTDGPLVTLAGAQTRLRQMKEATGRNGIPVTLGGLAGPLTVWLRGGTYPLRQPLVFSPEDSAPVTFAAYPGETPVIDGGERITGWQVTEINGQTAWVTQVPGVATGEWYFRQLFVNGRRALRPRLPKQGLFRMETVPGMPLPAGWTAGGYTQFVAAEGDVRPYSNLQDVEVVYVHFWIEERSTIEQYDPDTRLVTMARPSKAPLVGAFGTQLADYYLDNVREALSEPGEWYLDRAQGMLYYLPLPGEDPETADVYAPRLLQLLALVGKPDAGTYVEHLRFRGLTFHHTDWRHPDPSDGAVFVGPTTPPGSGSRRHSRGRMAGSGQGANDVPGVIFLEAARQCGFEECTIEHIGWYGIELSDACHGIRLIGNTIRDMGAGGIKISGGDAHDPAYRRTGNVLVTDNTISAGGRVFHSGIGVLSMNAAQVAIRHNHIFDLFYSGVSCGWVWGYAENVSRDNLIENNHIHDLGQGLLSDMGGIYTLGVQPGTVIRGNLIHDITKAHYGAWCIYPDEGSSHIVIERNICYRTNGEIFHQHYGRENMVRNNIFAFGKDAVIAHGRADLGHRAFTLERNILLTDGAPIFAGGYGTPLAARNHGSDLNLLFDVSGQPLTFRDNTTHDTLTLEGWRALGHDRHSTIADPQCADPQQGDFTLAADSPAVALGFAEFDLDNVGPRPATKRG